MSKKRGSLLSYRPDIKVVDATLRDGGLLNDFRFTEDFVRDLYNLILHCFQILFHLHVYIDRYYHY